VALATHPVLLVEPGESAGALERTLGDAGWPVTRGAMAEAVERAKRDQPSAIVFRGATDAAVALVKKLRCNARTALLPVVIVADASNGAREELARWGVTSVLGPATPDGQIADAVRQVAPLAPPVQAPDSELGRPTRLRALERTNLLDTPPEEPFDRLAQLTAQLLDVPVVLMSIVDRRRQFFKAQVGLSEPLAATRQTPITHSFCQWVVTGDEALVVEDARRDLLLSANPATVEMGIVAYAGVPLRGEPDETIGSFCAVDTKPRRWDARELRALHDAANLAQGLTVLRQAERLPPLTLDEFRVMAGVAGRAVEAAMRLHEAGKTRVNESEQHILVALASDLGRQLARVSAVGVRS
jgi:GAF domain-containing protein/methylmalonyl-CoA mutase cobalamin-binding subunit